MNKYNEKIVHVYSYIKNDGTVCFKHKLLEGCNTLWAGSGASEQGVVDKLMRYNCCGVNIKHATMIKAASIVDKYTDDKVQEVRL